MRTLDGAMTLDAREALAALAAEECRTLLRAAERMLGNLDDAEDAIQQVFLNAAKALDTLRKPAAVRAWVRRMLVRECSLRRQQRASESARRVPMKKREAMEIEPGEDFDSTPDWAVHEDESPYGVVATAAAIRARLAELPGDLRVLVEKRVFEGKALIDIARELELPRTTLKSRLDRAYGTLRPRLAPLMREMER